VSHESTDTSAGDAASTSVLSRLFAHRIELTDQPAVADVQRWPRCGGVCALVTGDDAFVLLIATGSIRRALHVRLMSNAEGAGQRRTVLRGVVRRVWWQPAYSAFESSLLYLQRARQLLGANYAKSLAFAPVWYAVLDAAQDRAYWQVTRQPAPAGWICAGPFATRRRCAELVADLEDLFDLCRYPEELLRAPQGKRCAYFDMGKCPAPCDGSIGLDVYRTQVGNSARFATGDDQRFIEDRKSRMAAAVSRLAFEEAQRHRDALARADAARNRRGRYGETPDCFDRLIVQRGGTRRTVRPFFCRAGVITVGEDVTAPQLARAAESWVARFDSSDKHAAVDADFRADSIALVCHYLGKAEKASGLYLNPQKDFHADVVAQRIHAVFFGRSAEARATRRD